MYSRLQQESKGGFCLWSQPGTKGSRAVQTSLYRTTAPLISASCASEFCQGLPEPPHGGAERCGRERAAGGRGGTGERAARVREGRVRGGRRAARAPCRRVPGGHRAVLGEEGVEGGASRSGTGPVCRAVETARECHPDAVCVLCRRRAPRRTERPGTQDCEHLKSGWWWTSADFARQAPGSARSRVRCLRGCAALVCSAASPRGDGGRLALGASVRHGMESCRRSACGMAWSLENVPAPGWLQGW